MASLKNKIRALLDSKLRNIGKYYVVKRSKENILGEGGFGVVWLAKDARNNKAVAIKQVKRKPETETFCERERRFMTVCTHKNIIQLFDHVKDDGYFYFILELCPAGNLDEFVKDKDIDFCVCLRYMMDISDGLQFMHSKDIGHRDIKPTNVLVKDHQCLKLADFGLSKTLTDSTSGESATGGVGSVPWMAPEISAAKTASHRSKYGLAVDIFSLALLFLSLLTHRVGEHLTAHTGV